MRLKYIFSVAASFLAMTAAAQTITFDTQDYAQLGVYDTWEESPFRDGRLQGNVAVIPNFLNQEDSLTGPSPNQSAQMLAVQRSRFGSNTFGARIDLSETFELTPTTRYVHVMIYKPTTGRVMLIGLGKRPERTGQSPRAEQFWELATTKVQADQWTDAVFAIKGNGGIDIHSLVVVPDCESPHNLTADYACYIDEIEINNVAEPRFRLMGDYGLAFDTDQPNQRTDRHLNGVAFSVPSQTNQQPTGVNQKLIYNNLTAQTLYARAGERVTPTVDYTGSWMNSYLYIDYDQNGKFEYNVNDDGTPAAASNVVAYSHANNRNSLGQSLTNAARNTLPLPAFQLPADIANGIYRVRYKVDWDCLDAAGNTAAGNTIWANGGGIVDVLLNIHGDNCQVNDANRNGKVVAASDGADLVSYRTPFHQPFTIRMVPERGFEYAGIRVRHGYNLAGDSLVHGNAQYRDTIFDRRLFVNNEFTLPADIMDGDVEIEGLFVEVGTLPVLSHIIYNVVDPEGRVITTRETDANSGEAYPETGLTTYCSAAYFDLQELPTELVPRHDTTLTLLYTSRFPFEVSTSLADARWYNIMIGEDHRPLYYNAMSKMRLYTREITDEEQQSPKYRWCIMGNPFDGFLIASAQTHRTEGSALPDSILTSSTNMLGTEGGGSFPVMRKYPFTANSKFSRGWFMQQTDSLDGQPAFFLGQMENPANRLNIRDNYLSYWTAGANLGSTVTLRYIGPESEFSAIAAPEAQAAPKAVYDLQGRRLPALPARKGIYIRDGRKVAH